MATRKAYMPDKLRPLMPPPPPIHPDMEIDRANMQRYARERYSAGLQINLNDL